MADDEEEVTIPRIDVSGIYGDFPQAKRFQVYGCPTCPNAHIVLFDKDDWPIAQFVIAPINLERINVDAKKVFEEAKTKKSADVLHFKRHE